MTAFIHPAILFAGCALIVIFLPVKIGRWFPPIAASLAVLSVLTMPQGSFATLHYLGMTLTLGRVDALSLVFAHVFAIQAVIGFIFAFHIKDRAQHVAALMYITGAFGSVFAADYPTLFIFWELMSVSSTFLVWLQTGSGLHKSRFPVFPVSHAGRTDASGRPAAALQGHRLLGL